MSVLLLLLLFQNTFANSVVDDSKKCKEILSLQTCEKLETIAQVFHERAGTVDGAVRDALSRHITKTTDIIDYVKNYLVEKANNFKCEDVLKSDQCVNLLKLATKFKLTVGNLTLDIKEAIADGVLKGKAIYQKTIEILLEKVNDLSCEQLIDVVTCQRIKNFAGKVHASASDIKNSIIDAYSKGLTSAKDFLNDVIEYLTNEVSCEDVLSNLACSKLQYLADKFGTSYNQIVGFLRQSLMKGITNISDLYKSATTSIMKNWLGMATYKSVKRSIDEMTEDDFIKVLDLLESHATLKRL